MGNLLDIKFYKLFKFPYVGIFLTEILVSIFYLLEAIIRKMPLVSFFNSFGFFILLSNIKIKFDQIWESLYSVKVKRLESIGFHLFFSINAYTKTFRPILTLFFFISKD